jgi:hypothetical protein
MSLIFDPLVDIEVCHYTHKSVMHHSHVHPQYELYFCTVDVEQLSVVNGVEYKYKYPCVIISSPYTIHSMSCTDPKSADYDRFVIYFNQSTLNSLTERYLCRELCYAIRYAIRILSTFYVVCVIQIALHFHICKTGDS